MLIGLWGPFAVGKTTYLNAYMCLHSSNEFKRVHFVHADLALEYHWNGLRWMDNLSMGDKDGEKRWKGLNEDKVEFIDDMVGDDRRVWVVESARYFSGMYECLVETHRMYGGGMAFIIPITDGPTMAHFMRTRCEERGKTYREEYWDPKRVEYEAAARYLNAAAKWFTPNNIPFDSMFIDKDRKLFSAVGQSLDHWIKKPARKWYK